MPGFNGTGPDGQGPMTGRAMGNCGQSSERSGFDRRNGDGCRRAFGHRSKLNRGRMQNNN